MVQELNLEVLHLLYLTVLCCKFDCLAYTQFIAYGLIDNFQAKTDFFLLLIML